LEDWSPSEQFFLFFISFFLSREQNRTEQCPAGPSSQAWERERLVVAAIPSAPIKQAWVGQNPIPIINSSSSSASLQELIGKSGL
jgi:hypothetical protein